VKYNGETKETVIAGMGDLQINMILDKIKNLAKIVAETRIPRVAYRETITKKSGAEYTHKKQTGGHGQYARVVFEIEPLARGVGYEFENKLFGQSVSRGFIPGIEKGIHQAMESGVVAGYPVVDVKTAITDGKEHPVDSSEMAFKLASRGAFRKRQKRKPGAPRAYHGSQGLCGRKEPRRCHVRPFQPAWQDFRTEPLGGALSKSTPRCHK